MNAKDAKDYRCYTYFYISSAYIQLFFNQFTQRKGCRPHLPFPPLPQDHGRKKQALNNEHIISMVGHLFQNYDTIYVRFFPTYTCNHSCYTIYVRFLSRILAFYSQVYDHFLTNAHIYAHQKTHIYALQTSMWYMRSQKVVI